MKKTDSSLLNINKKVLDNIKWDFPVHIGHYKVPIQLNNFIKEISDINSIILISGETGTGKSLLAKSIHLNSIRRDKPFLTYEKIYIKKMLILKNGKINNICAHAKIDNKTLYTKMKKYGLNKMDYR